MWTTSQLLCIRLITVNVLCYPCFVSTLTTSAISPRAPPPLPLPYYLLNSFPVPHGCYNLSDNFIGKPPPPQVAIQPAAL